MPIARCAPPVPGGALCSRPAQPYGWELAFVAAAFCLRLAPALALPTAVRPDEVFQTLEPAFRMLTGSGIVTWEWRDGLRSALYPGVLAGLMAVPRLAGLGPASYLALIAAVQAALSAACVAVAFRAGWRIAGLGAAILCATACTVWPDLVSLGPRPLTEVQGGHLLLLGTYLAWTAGDKRRTLAGAGLLLALACVLRLQLVPAAAVAAGYAGRLSGRRWLLLAAGGVVPLAAMGIQDAAVWGTPFYTALQTLRINVIADDSAHFSAEPPLWYLAQLVALWGWALLPLTVLFVLGMARAPLLAAVAITVFVSHSAVAHKEISYIFPALPPALIVAGVGTARLLPAGRGVLAASALWAAAAAGVSASPVWQARWSQDAGPLLAAGLMRADPALCGVGVRGPALSWFMTGGDVYLGRAVPYYGFATAAGAARVAPAVNYVLGGADVAEGMPGFSRVRCWTAPGGGETCLARAEPGKACRPDDAFSLASVSRLGRPGTQFGADGR